jgi:hypothetical protein
VRASLQFNATRAASPNLGRKNPCTLLRIPEVILAKSGQEYLWKILEVTLER